MGAIQSWPLLPLLIIGIVNVLACYWTVYWGLDWRIGVLTLISLALAAGWFTTERTWGIVLALMMPVMFIGGERHGRPWHWLIGGLFYPPIFPDEHGTGDRSLLFCCLRRAVGTR